MLLCRIVFNQKALWGRFVRFDYRLQNLHIHIYTECGYFSDPFHGSLMQCPLQQCQLHHCPFNEVISRHMGADVAKKTHCDVIVIDAHLPPYPLHNLGGWHQDNNLHYVETAVAMVPGQPLHWLPPYFRQRRGSQLEWFTALLVSSPPWNLCLGPAKGNAWLPGRQ